MEELTKQIIRATTVPLTMMGESALIWGLDQVSPKSLS
jgi:hypothetical protein